MQQLVVDCCLYPTHSLSLSIGVCYLVIGGPTHIAVFMSLQMSRLLFVLCLDLAAAIDVTDILSPSLPLGYLLQYLLATD